MENNEPLLKEEKEELNVGLSEASNDSNLEISEDTTSSKPQEENNDTPREANADFNSEEKDDTTSPKPEEENNSEPDYQVEEKYKKEVIKPLKEESKEKLDDQPKTEKKKKNTVPIVVTIILVLLVSYLLAQTCINFYYGFKYKDYVPENFPTQQP